MTEDEKNKSIKIKLTIEPASALARGKIINQAALLESVMDIYISRHFSKEPIRQLEMIELILSSSRITFENKRQVFKFLVDKYEPEFAKRNKSYANDLDTLNRQRNIFAHYPLNVAIEANELFEKHRTISFIKFKNATALEIYNEKKIDQYLKLFNKMITQIIELIEKQPDTPSPSPTT